MAAQYYMLKSYCISKSEVVYINLICMIGSVFVSLYLVLVYFAFYSDFISANVAIVLLLVLFSINAAYIFWNSVFMNWIITFLNSFATFKLRPFFYSRGIMLNMQLLYVLGALLAGLSGYCLLKGVGLPSSSGDTLILLVSINVSWLISHFVVVAPRGLGVREGTMLWMLNKVVSVETALLLPILFRALISLVDLLFVVIALCVGWRNGAFRGGQVEVSKNYDQD